MMTTRNEAVFPSGGYRANLRIAEQPGIPFVDPEDGRAFQRPRHQAVRPLSHGCHPASVYAAAVVLATLFCVPLTLLFQWLWR